MNYKTYIASRAWTYKKLEMLTSKRSYSCYVCFNTENLHLHHKTYKRLKNEKLKDLMWLCSEHHNELHQLSKDLSFEQMNNAYKFLMKKYKSKRKARKISKSTDIIERQMHIISIQKKLNIKLYL